MEMMEIVLLIAGGIIFILSFFIPDKKNVSGKDGGAEGVRVLAEGELQGLISQEMNSIRTHVDDVVEEAVTYAMEKTERSLERLSNEKIMAVSEYSDTVLAEIHKNHEEAMFLYDMLNNKHINLKNTVSEVDRTVKEAEATVMNFQKLMPETLSASEERILNRAAEPAAQRDLDRYAQENSGMERFGTGAEKHGTESYGTDNFGLGSSGAAGLENPGIESASMDNFPVAESGMENSGMQNIGMENIGIGNIGIGKATVRQTGTEESGLESADAPLEGVSSGKDGSVQDVDGHRRNNNEKILGLYQQGKSTVAIAKELGLGVGEVKLVIDLFKNQ